MMPANRSPAPATARRQRHPWRNRAAVLVLALVLLISLAWVIGLARFAREIPDGVADSVTGTDAIVVLTGGSQRVMTGLRLLAENKAERVLISGVHPGVGVGELLRVAGSPLPSPLEARIDAGYGARDTAGNAAEAAGWMQARQFRSLRLVTGSYHMPRSILEFQCALPGTQVVPHPVFPDRVQKRAWWRYPGTAALIISEYNKFLLATLTHRLFGRGSGCR
jgi:uncharacterized SAM-binding protein YcdF (DUF218 family)